jgi:uncharacterized protein YnzC (UPF0291/DUF896 family)
LLAFALIPLVVATLVWVLAIPESMAAYEVWKQKELNTYIGEIEEKIAQNQRMDENISEELRTASSKMDETLKSFVSPYIAQRESLVSVISTNENEIRHIDELIKVRRDIQSIGEEILKLQSKQKEIEISMEEERKKSIIREDLIKSLSLTFYSHLEMVRFPKLSDAYIDDKFVPYVRGQRYNQLSSEGAISLASICWLTSIFAETTRLSLFHPGFLMIDNIQSGIGIGATTDEEFRDQRIVEGLYMLLKRMSESEKYQIIVVDNHPPDSEQDRVIVYFSGNPSKHPYGFIHDAVS